MARLAPITIFNSLLAGGTVTTYITATSTPKTAYTDRGAGTPLANPETIDNSGVLQLWLDTDAAYRFVLKDLNGVTVETIDDVVPIAETADFSGLSNIVEDTTPQLGGNLDVNGKSIVSTSSGDILLTPDGTGTVVVGTDLDVDNININGNTIISSDAAGDINITPDTTGDLVLDGLKWPQADGTSGQFIKTDAAGQLAFASSSGKVLQMVFSTSTTAVTDTGNIPKDNTIPQITEGTDIGVTRAVTPASATSNLIIELYVPVVSVDGTESVTFALFKDSDVNAIQVGTAFDTSSETGFMSLKYLVASSDTTARTYSARFGASSENSDILSDAGSQLFGSADAIMFSIMEVEA